MGFQFGGTQANVTISTSQATYHDLILLSADRSTIGTTTLGTCPANKVWRIIGASVCANSQSTGDCKAEIQINGVTLLKTIVTGGATTSNVDTDSISFDLTACPKITAGQTITLVQSGANWFTSGQVQYYEESA